MSSSDDLHYGIRMYPKGYFSRNRQGKVLEFLICVPHTQGAR